METRTFPISSKIYHFHPIAFVEQMKRHANCFCNRDITVEVFEEIFGKGPWFVGKLGIVDMKRDYPDVYNISTEILVKELNRTMKDYGVKTCLQKAHFLGQIGGETGFQFTAEGADGADYDIGSHKSFHENFVKYVAFLNKYTSGDDITVKTTSSVKPTQIEKNIEIYKKAYDDYEKASSDKRTVDPIKSLKEKHDEYLSFKKEKEKFDSIYENSYKTRQYSSVYKKWRHGYRRYTTCIKNGNTEVGDGKKYRGHGMLQLTWKNNYEIFKNRLKLDCVTDPDLLSSSLKNAFNMAGCWWRKPLTGWGDINTKAEEDDFLMSTLAINGGMRGVPHRYKYTKKALLSLGCKECANNQSLNVGNYTFETSKIEKSNYCYNKKTRTPIASRVKLVKEELEKAKNEYEK